MAHITHFARYSKNTRLSAGRTVLALRQLYAVATAQQLADLSRVCREGITQAQEVVQLSLRRRAQRESRGGGEARAIDRRMDKLIKALYRRLEDIADSFAGEPRGARAAELMQTYFPDGYYAITSLPYEDELAAVDLIFLAFSEGDASGDVEPLELRSIVDAIGALLPEYSEALQLRELVTAGDVRTARDLMHATTCAAVAWVLFTYRRPEDEDRRGKLLAPFDDQYARAAAARKRSSGGVVAEGEDGAAPELDGVAVEDTDLEEALLEEVLLEEALLDEAVAGGPDETSQAAEAGEDGAAPIEG